MRKNGKFVLNTAAHDKDKYFRIIDEGVVGIETLTSER